MDKVTVEIGAVGPASMLAIAEIAKECGGAVQKTPIRGVASAVRVRVVFYNKAGEPIWAARCSRKFCSSVRVLGFHPEQV